MKKIVALFLMLVLIVAATACSQQAGPAETPVSVQTDAQNTPAETLAGVVTFADPVLEAMVRATMGKPEGGITVADAQAVTRLNLSAEWWQQYLPQNTLIKNIGGLECFTNLESLDLSGQAIADTAPLAGLTKLTALSLSDNPIADISPLAKLTNLKWLKLTGCAAQDYTPLVSLVNLNCLMLNKSTISDVSPLVALTNLKYLFLANSQIKNYLPLMEIYPNLEQSDFTVSATLAGLGFRMDNGSKQAIYNVDKGDIRINHAEWGVPSQELGTDCVRTIFNTDSGYKLDFGFYPGTNTYRVLISKNGNFVVNYLYDSVKDSYRFEVGDRASSEQNILASLGDATDQDVLQAPITLFNNTIKETVGIPADVLFTMSFDENTQMQSPYEKMGFAFIDYRGTYTYEKDDIAISIHKTQWDNDVDAEEILEWNMSFDESDVKGYQLNILYFADDSRYSISLNKGGEEARFDAYPATGKYEYDPRNNDTLRRMFGEAFATKGDDFLDKPLATFEKVVQERFGMSINELYALPAR